MPIGASQKHRDRSSTVWVGMPPRFYISYFQVVTVNRVNVGNRTQTQKSSSSHAGRFGESHWWSEPPKPKRSQHALD
jgi:hypothetical protein